MPAAKVLTVSDGVAAGTRDDTAGDALAERLTAAGFEIAEREVVADGAARVSAALRRLCRAFDGLVLTTGGTGFGPRDETPEGTRAVLGREAPGFSEAMRRASDADGRGMGMLSRGVCGTIGASLVCNLPGSRAGALECLEAVLPGVPHALELLAGAHPH